MAKDIAESSIKNTSKTQNAINSQYSDLKLVPIKVIFLDGSSDTFKLLDRCPGQELFDMVISKLNVPEPDYFDLEYLDKDGNYCWLDHFKSIAKPLSSMSLLMPTFEFSVKFYTSHPNLLENDYTRFLFALQIKKNLYHGTLRCNEDTKALLLAFVVQSEIGDYKYDDLTRTSTNTIADVSYLKKLKILKHPKASLLEKIHDLHKTLEGMNSTEANYRLLDSARKLEFYGIRVHPAKDHENLPLNLGVGHTGIVVFQGNIKINTFNWSKIRKLSFKRKKFLINLHPEGYVDLFIIWLVEGYYEDNVEFFFESRNACKNFWKKCVENHAFFRSLNLKGRIGAGSGGSSGSFLKLIHKSPHPYISKLTLKEKDENTKDDLQDKKSAQENLLTRPKKSIFHSGSRFRYVGRTQKQLFDLAREKQTDSTFDIQQRSASASRVSTRYHLNLNEPLQRIFKHQADFISTNNEPTVDNNDDFVKNKSKSHSNIHDKPSGNNNNGQTTLGNHYRLLLLSTNQFSTSLLDNDHERNIRHSQSVSHLKATHIDELSTFVPRMNMKSISFNLNQVSDCDKVVKPKFANLISPMVDEPKEDSDYPLQMNGLDVNTTAIHHLPEIGEVSSQTICDNLQEQLPKENIAEKNEETRELKDSIDIAEVIEKAYSSLGITLDSSKRLPGLLSDDKTPGDCSNLPIANTMDMNMKAVNKNKADESVLIIHEGETTLERVTRDQPPEYPESDHSNFDEPNSIIGGSLEAISMITGFTAWSNWDDMINDNHDNEVAMPATVKIRDVSRARSEPENKPEGKKKTIQICQDKSCTMSVKRESSSKFPSDILPSDDLKKSKAQRKNLKSATSKNSVHSLSRNNKLVRNRLYNLIKELLNTEKTYLNELKVITTLLMDHIKMSKNLTLMNYFSQNIWPTLQFIRKAHMKIFELFSQRVSELEQANCAYLLQKKKMNNLYRISNKENFYKNTISQMCDSKKLASQYYAQSLNKVRRYRHRIRDLRENHQMTSDESESDFDQEALSEHDHSSDEDSANINNDLHRLDMNVLDPLFLSNPSMSFEYSSEFLFNDNSSSYNINNNEIMINEELLRITEKNLMNASRIADIFCHNADIFNIYEKWITKLPDHLWTLWQFYQGSDQLEQLTKEPEKPNVENSNKDTKLCRSCRSDSDISMIEKKSQLNIFKRQVSLTNLSEEMSKHHRQVERDEAREILRNFESTPACFKSLIELLFQPHRRILYYRALFINFTVFYSYCYQEYIDTRAFLQKIGKLVQDSQSNIITAEKLAKSFLIMENVHPARGIFHTTPKQKNGAISKCQTDNLITPSEMTRLIRFGWLQKHSNRGYQARMVFLYNDRLVFASKISNYFKLHGVIGLSGAIIVLNPQFSQPSIKSQRENQHSFALIIPGSASQNSQTPLVYTKRKRIIFSAPSEEIRQVWFVDLRKYIEYASSQEYIKNPNCSKIFGFFRILETTMTTTDVDSTVAFSSRLDTKSNLEDPYLSEMTSLPLESDNYTNNDEIERDPIQISSNTYFERNSIRFSKAFMNNSKLKIIKSAQTTCENQNLLYLCWHRQSTLSMQNLLNSAECEMSGYLLRKFKNNSGWQKLWTVFTNMTLYFFKSPDEMKPLASLPLVGYRLETKFRDSSVIKLPSCYLDEKVLDKTNIICMTYKNHVYLFRAENSFMYIKWCESLQCVLNGKRPHHLELLENILLDSHDNIDDANIDSPETESNASDIIINPDDLESLDQLAEHLDETAFHFQHTEESKSEDANVHHSDKDPIEDYGEETLN